MARHARIHGCTRFILVHVRRCNQPHATLAARTVATAYARVGSRWPRPRRPRRAPAASDAVRPPPHVRRPVSACRCPRARHPTTTRYGSHGVHKVSSARRRRLRAARGGAAVQRRRSARGWASRCGEGPRRSPTARHSGAAGVGRCPPSWWRLRAPTHPRRRHRLTCGAFGARCECVYMCVCVGVCAWVNEGKRAWVRGCVRGCVYAWVCV